MKLRLALGVLLLLAGCGGDGGGNAPTPPPANQAPAFTSPATATVAENIRTAYQATASDPGGGALSFSISGGADATQFTVTTAGMLSFVTPPNFEAPRDADGNNVYQVQLRVSDGALSSTLDLAVTVTNDREGIAVKRVASGFSSPLFVAAIPGDTRVFVVEKGGGVYFLDPATGAKTLAFTAGNLSTDGERGLLGLVATDRYARNGEVLAVATAPDGAVEVREYHVGSVNTTNCATCYLTVLRVPHADFGNHNGGWIGVGPDGYFYVGIGDGGGAGDPGNNAQNPSSRLGKILRIARNPDPFAGAAPAYYIPAPGNPFVGGGGDPYVFALGLRNPFRASFSGNRLLIGDVGQDRIEEIDAVQTNQPGLNFGWPFREGTQGFRGTAPAGLIDPLSQYSHGSGPTEGASIIGGYVYRGPVASLRDSYVFGDFVSGNLWTVPAAALQAGQLLASSSYERRNLDFTPDAGSINQLSSFGEDAAGNLYIVDLGGDIFMVTAA